MSSRLSQLLNDRGLTQLDLTFLARVSTNTIYGILRHGHKPRAEVQQRIAAALGVKVEEVWGESKRREKKEHPGGGNQKRGGPDES